MFNDEKQDNFVMIRNLILLVLVLVIGTVLIINYTKKDEEDVLDKNIYLMISAVKLESIDGIPKTTNVGEEKYYKDSLGKVIDFNGINFIIEEFTNTSVVLKLNNDYIDLYEDASCPNKLCTKGTKISLNGSKTITLTDSTNTYSYTIYFKKKK